MATVTIVYYVLRFIKKKQKVNFKSYDLDSPSVSDYCGLRSRESNAISRNNA